MIDSAVDPRDLALQRALPTLPVPRYGLLPELEPGRVRYLLAGNGLFVEARSNVLHVRLPVESFTAARLPYGLLESFVRAPAMPLGRDLLDEMVRLARADLPAEWAGLILGTASAGQLHVPTVNRASPAFIQYQSGSYDPLDVLADVHSHGHAASFFSSQDDRDDQANPSPCFFALVLGRLGRETPTICRRLVVHGRFFDRRDETWSPALASAAIDDPCEAEFASELA